eukprot:COSAG06_NODE_67282_length_252_cov_0.679739_1_plen_56_part_10
MRVIDRDADADTTGQSLAHVAVGRVVANMNQAGTVRLCYADGSESDEVRITALSKP